MSRTRWRAPVNGLDRGFSAKPRRIGCLLRQMVPLQNTRLCRRGALRAPRSILAFAQRLSGRCFSAATTSLILDTIRFGQNSAKLGTTCARHPAVGMWNPDWDLVMVRFF